VVEAGNVRITVISPSVDRHHGTERAVAEFIERLVAQHNDHVDLYAQRVSDLNPGALSDNTANDSAKITWYRVNTFPGPHLLQFLGWLFLNRRARRRNQQTSDVIFSPGINAFDADVILVHAMFHRVAELQQSRPSEGLRGLHRKLYYALLCYLERRVYKNPRVKLAAVSRHTADQLARYFARNDVTVIPNGVDSNHFSPQAIGAMRERYRQQWNCSPQDFVILLVGNDWHNKGLATLLQSIAQCRDLPLRLLLVGQDERTAFRSRAEKLSISERVQFPSPVEDIRTVYAAADLLVAPSLEDSFNLPVLEAMSCGLPVIVSPRAGVSEWLTDSHDSVVLKNPENAEELSAAIRKLARDPAARDAMAANAIQTAKKFSWDAHAGQLRKLLVQAGEEKLRRSSQPRN
jgi:UDP-glucose:(heptosyl)LPS alpha-1,3-glucosyltransferase